MITVAEGTREFMEDCKLSLGKSLLGDVYFGDKQKENAFIKEGIEKKEIFIALNIESKCMGFMRIEPNFAFSGYPLLRTIAVKEEYRGQGIGSKLLDFYENIAYKDSPKLFLFVSELNDKARRLYGRRGYVKVGSIPDFYALGIKEFLFMKQK